MNWVRGMWLRLLRQIDRQGAALHAEAMRRRGWAPVRSLRQLGIKEQKHG